MKQRTNEKGSTATLVTIVILAVFLVISLSFGIWSFLGRQDYKYNADTKVKTAVDANTKSVQAQDAKDYAESAKQPLKLFVGPEAYGSVHINYPKTWSAYVVTGTGGQPLDAYFNPDVVPSSQDINSVFALRLQVSTTSYNQTLTQYQGLQKQGKVTVAPYALPKNPNVVGVRIDGQLTQTKQGSMIILPVRDKTIKIWIESNQFATDFNNLILPNASLSP